MLSFYNVIGRSLRAIALFALVGATVGQDAIAQIAFPDFAHPRATVFTVDGADEIQLVGTHSFGVYRSVPGAIGANKWSKTTGLTIPLTVNDMVVLNSGTVLLGASGSGGQQTNVEATGLFTSADAGLTWTPIEKSAFDSLAVHTVQAISESPADGVIFISADDGNIFISQDSGVSWVFNGRLPGGSSQTPWSILAHPTIAGTAYAGTPGYGVFVTTDHGGLWQPFTDNATLVVPWSPADPWTSVGGGNYVFDLEMNPANDNQMYAATAKGVWRFNDVTSVAGTWTRMAAPDSSITLENLTTINLHPEVRSLAFNNAGTTLYMASWGFGVLTTTDFTGTPTPTQIGLRGSQVSVVAVSPSGTLFAGDATGIHQIGAASATDVNLGADVPESFALSQNYPNPFNPTTSISFDLPAQTNVTLNVFDVLGRRVAQLANGVFGAGAHAVTMDASGLQSGLYIYRLDAGDKSIARTMSLVK
jgi:Secretion system C-terminal sorting domain